jgi:hypothetical protein
MNEMVARSNLRTTAIVLAVIGWISSTVVFGLAFLHDVRASHRSVWIIPIIVTMSWGMTFALVITAPWYDGSREAWDRLQSMRPVYLRFGTYVLTGLYFFEFVRYVIAEPAADSMRMVASIGMCVSLYTMSLLVAVRRAESI